MDKTKDVLPLTEAFYYILISLYPAPAHGYGMMQDIERRSGGRVKIGAGTLYTALNTLQTKGWIEPHPAPADQDARRKLYAITAEGRAVAATEMDRLEELLEAGRLALQEEQEGRP